LITIGSFLLTPGYSRVPVTAGSKWLETIQERFRAMGVIGKTTPSATVTTAGGNQTVLPDPVPTRPANYTRYLTVATMMKNQRRWLREWIEFNILIGVEHFLIYDNDSTDSPLEILQAYIDSGHVTFIPWPPKDTAPPYPPRTVLEQWQGAWFRDSLDTCIAKSWTIHQQAPCQLAAYIDAIWRTKGGVSRWLGIWDIDEFVYIPQSSRYSTLSETLRGEFPDHTQIRMWGNVFGTSGHVQAAQRQEGSPLQALVTEEYTYRSELDRISQCNLI
jgi:hypothetical protein